MKIFPTKKGFTMAELIIVMGILVVLFSISFNTYRIQRDQTEFNNSLVKILSVVKTARNYAVTSQAPKIGGTVPVEGYGVYIDKDAHTLILFSNSSTGDVDAYDAANDGEEETYIIPDKTLFDELVGDGMAVVGDEAVIIFRPPLADAYISNNATVTITELSMIFSRDGAPAGSQQKVIKINRIAGFPEIEL